jgi:hypothetical protein
MHQLILLAEMVEGRWRPGIGDPTVMGWVTVAVYFIAVIGCSLAARREPLPDGTRRPHSRPSKFWLGQAALMLALGINKQLDLQSLATQIGRDVIRAWNLYQERREFQAGFIAVVALVCAGSLALILWAAGRNLTRRWPAIVGMIFILGFVLIRAASFHNVDIFLAARLGGVKWNWIFELSGITIVAVSAFRVVLARPPRTARPENAMTYRYRINP